MTDGDRRREQLRATFDRAASDYHRFRPRYPTALIDAAIGALASTAHVLEIGPGSGIATEAFANRGLRVTAIELGEQLAREAADNLRGHPQVAVHHASFDDWSPPSGVLFDAVVAATAWHWLDPATKYHRAHSMLQEGGRLAFWSALHVVPDGGDPFFEELQEVYDELGQSRPADHHFPKPGELLDQRGDIADSGLFRDARIEHFDWEIRYTAEDYIGLLQTFSGHIAMEANTRTHLYAEIRRRVALRDHAPIRRHWGAALHTATRAPR